MKRCKLISTLIISLILMTFTINIAQEYPLRAKFPTTKSISTKDLFSDYGKNILIVDVRSDVEYDVIHIKDALNILWGQMNFIKELEAAVKGNKSSKIAFYCNGITCAKSYHAAEDAQKAGFTNVFVYDAGVLDWTNTYPDKSVLLGKSPVNKSKIISKKDFESKLLNKDEFLKQVKDPDAVIIDIRDHAQRKQNPDFGKNVILSPMDKIVKALSEPMFKKNNANKTIYFFDAVGKQVEWLQYYLADAGYTNYYFLKGGVLSIFPNSN